MKRRQPIVGRRCCLFPIFTAMMIIFGNRFKHHVEAFTTHSSRHAFRHYALRTKSDTPPSSSPRLYLPHDGTSGRPIRSVAAPMVAASDFAYRSLCRQYGVDLTFTQMLHVRNLNNDASFWQNHVDLWEQSTTSGKESSSEDVVPSVTTLAQENFLQGMSQNDLNLPSNWQDYISGPVIVQLAGHEPGAVVQAAVRLYEQHPHITGFDLNCGCPQQIARKGNFGAFFMEADNGVQASRVLHAVRQALPADATVSCKCRLPLQTELWKERVSRLQDAGIDFLTIHGRTLKENKTQTGPASTAAIQQAVEWLRTMPVIANGGVEHYGDVERIFRGTGAAAVMSSEGLLERPDLFQRVSNDDEASPRQVVERQFQIARDYLAWARLFPPLPGVLGQQGGSFNIVRGHLFKFLHRYWQEQTDLRDRLSSHQRRLCLQDAYELVDELHERYCCFSDETLAQQASSLPDASWYRRHWNAMGVTSTTSRRQDAVTAKQEIDSLSVTERKTLVQERIARLRRQRQERTAALP